MACHIYVRLRIVLTKCRRDMNNSGTICQCYISITCYIKCFFILLCGAVISALIKRLILFVLKILTFVCLKNFISLYTILLIAKFTKNCIKKATAM